MSFVVCFAVLAAACIFAWVIFGTSIDKMFMALAEAISRAKPG